MTFVCFALSRFTYGPRENHTHGVGDRQVNLMMATFHKTGTEGGCSFVCILVSFVVNCVWPPVIGVVMTRSLAHELHPHVSDVTVLSSHQMHGNEKDRVRFNYNKYSE